MTQLDDFCFFCMFSSRVPAKQSACHRVSTAPTGERTRQILQKAYKRE